MKTPKFTPRSAYYVLWMDACFSWDEPEVSCSPCRLIGWFIKEDERGYVFSMEIEGDDDGGETSRFHMSIPYGMVVEWRELEVG